MNTINLLGENHRILDMISINISDSFVDRSIKTGNGNGESRLYISNQTSSTNGRFFEFDMSTTIPISNQRNITNYYHPCIYRAIYLKDNLLKYMQDVESDYLHPKFNFKNNIKNQYSYKLNEVNALNNIIEFTIHKQDGNMDLDRFYIGSGNSIWHKVRSYALPFISKYLIYKVQNDITGEILYFFQLVHNSKLDNEIYTLETSEKLLLDSIQNNTTISKTAKDTLTVARIGQGQFRNNCLSVLDHCPFTNVYNHSVLRASHIIPWSRCSNNEDRVNGFNGITLSPFYDVLFDKGFISFENDGRLLISSQVTEDILISLNLTENIKFDLNNINGQRNRFLEYHREYIFKK